MLTTTGASELFNGAARRNLLSHQLALARFLEGGVIPTDNGIVERLHVHAAIARKNFLFAGSDAGAERAAIVFTILGCCTLVGANPIEYLGDMSPKPTGKVRLHELPDMLPAQWKARRESAHVAT